MRIKNYNELARTGARRKALDMIEAGLRAVDPYRAVANALRLVNGRLIVKSLEISLSRYRRIVVFGAGKASGRMGEAAEDVLGDRIDGGVIIVPKGTGKAYRLRRVRILEGSHPIPDRLSVESAGELVERLKASASEDTLVLFLISGGGSALMTLPAEGVSLASMQSVSKRLMEAGADIYELNTVRKHLSMIKGGQLARLAQPSTVLSLIISDVIGDDLSVIASGPTAPDPTTFREALMVLRRRGVWDDAPQDVRERILMGVAGKVPETPKPGDPVFSRVFNVIVANNMDALRAMEGAAGIKTHIVTSLLEGEAREASKVLCSIARQIRVYGEPVSPPVALLFGGETTVTVRGSGVGGRNQEMVLAAVEKLRLLGRGVFVSIGTDGVDGPTDAAGAIADEQSWERAVRAGLDPDEYLRNNDSYTFFKKLGDLVFTGPTGTNVGDVGVLLLI